jgi:hypothetical protein
MIEFGFGLKKLTPSISADSSLDASFVFGFVFLCADDNIVAYCNQSGWQLHTSRLCSNNLASIIVIVLRVVKLVLCSQLRPEEFLKK